MHHIYNYAIKFGILGNDAVDYSQYVTIDKHKRKYPKTPFNTRQLNRVRAVGAADSWSPNYFEFNAQAYNSIYGASTTVQPPSIALIPQIKY